MLESIARPSSVEDKVPETMSKSEEELEDSSEDEKESDSDPLK